MKTHDNAQKLIDWLGEHQAATPAQVAATGMMNSRAARSAFDYGMSHGAFVKFRRAGAGGNERGWYRWTGKQLPKVQAASGAHCEHCFDSLLDAWGIARTPPPLAAPLSGGRYHGHAPT